MTNDRRPTRATGDYTAGAPMKPMVLMIGADKGEVGKTTITRTLLGYLASKSMPTRAFDAKFPRGTLNDSIPTSPRWSTSRPRARVAASGFVDG